MFEIRKILVVNILLLTLVKLPRPKNDTCVSGYPFLPRKWKLPYSFMVFSGVFSCFKHLKRISCIKIGKLKNKCTFYLSNIFQVVTRSTFKVSCIIPIKRAYLRNSLYCSLLCFFNYRCYKLSLFHFVCS